MTIDPKLALTDEDREEAWKLGYSRWCASGSISLSQAINAALDAAHASWLKRQPPQGTPLTLDDRDRNELLGILSGASSIPVTADVQVRRFFDWLRTKTPLAPAQPRKWTQEDHATVEATLNRATNAPFDHSEIAIMILNDLAPPAPPPAEPTFADEQTHKTLSEANKARQLEWDPGNQLSLAFRGNELAGEVGEACNVIKKLERERLGIRGSRDTVEHLAEELADVVMCADLIAMQAGIDLAAAITQKFNATSEKYGLRTRLAARKTLAELEAGR